LESFLLGEIIMSSVALQKERPAYVSFEKRAMEDREATIATGMYTAKDVDFVIITPPGTKDQIERNAKEWLEQMEFQMRQDRLPREFYEAYRKAYEYWKESGEVPLNGTYVKTCPALSPSQIDSLLRANIKTMEDLAAASEEAVARLGMGGRSLKMLAENWLKSAKDTGASAGQITALQLKNQELEASNKELVEQVRLLAAQVEAFLQAGQGSKPAANTTKL
jgi:hypothetical protein